MKMNMIMRMTTTTTKGREKQIYEGYNEDRKEDNTGSFKEKKKRKSNTDTNRGIKNTKAGGARRNKRIVRPSNGS